MESGVVVHRFGDRSVEQAADDRPSQKQACDCLGSDSHAVIDPFLQAEQAVIEPESIDPELLRRLQALGYVQ